jgi:hypothetical protein
METIQTYPILGATQMVIQMITQMGTIIPMIILIIIMVGDTIRFQI